MIQPSRDFPQTRHWVQLVLAPASFPQVMPVGYGCAEGREHGEEEMRAVRKPVRRSCLSVLFSLRSRAAPSGPQTQSPLSAGEWPVAGQPEADRGLKG